MYTVYKIKNVINNKFYIGVHKTTNPNDSYYGSGKAINQAIIKYGKENFSKEVLFVTEQKEDAYNKEKELTKNFGENSNYNMKLGGVGGFTREHALKGYNKSKEKLILLGGQEAFKAGKSFGGTNCKNDPKICGRKGGLANKGKPKSEEFKQKIRDCWKLKKQEKSIG